MNSLRANSLQIVTDDGNEGHHSPAKTNLPPSGVVEMQIHIPKIKVSKYFKTKYQGAYIPPS